MSLWWIAFTILILGLLALDLGFFNRKAHIIRLKEALLWTSFWVSLGLSFGVGIYYFHGHHKALEYFTGYLIEYSLSVDNLFVFLLIFRYFRVPHKLEHKALFWGILLALITRAVFIFTGVALINKFHWIIYIFGAFLIFTAVRMAFGKGREIHPGKNILVRMLRKTMPMTRNYQEGHFFVIKRGVRFATPLLAVILALETTDIIFAVDSIPAVLAITNDPFIIYTSNVFAILGLRSLFFAISGIMRIFHYLQYGLIAILSFVGVKMLISDFYKIPINISLLIIASFLALAIIVSLLWPKPQEEIISPPK
ncbi:MAG: TerC family protein [Smithellaceae bacterium]|jgi:tellurite resistance protein TerC|nr:TerC family protein [Syntrophaceae bacterium]MDX9816786.1 TerC family protein [Smithellaceae bacterium]NMD04990.1 TerC family protein [Deltaproteobacteria bacterium]MBP8607902.1 TerC family protein [Syntrophaceae bacterium]HNQ18704.1 TerC family protein [Smithellaceae bacterium]